MFAGAQRRLAGPKEIALSGAEKSTDLSLKKGEKPVTETVRFRLIGTRTQQFHTASPTALKGPSVSRNGCAAPSNFLEKFENESDPYPVGRDGARNRH